MVSIRTVMSRRLHLVMAVTSAEHNVPCVQPGGHFANHARCYFKHATLPNDFSARHHVSVAVIPDLRVLFHPRMLSSDSWSTSNGVKPITATATTSL